MGSFASQNKLSVNTRERERDKACFLNQISSPSRFVPFPCSTDAFLEQAVSYQQFVDNPGIIDDPNLVVKIGNK